MMLPVRSDQNRYNNQDQSESSNEQGYSEPKAELLENGGVGEMAKQKANYA
jgi:hypothetical protein